MPPYPLELLAPARDLACGLAAINHGADAVYIGGPRFGARAAAGNSLGDIERLVRHAHLFSARVYITLNTLFSDAELEDAVALAHQLYAVGADALIIQDMGLLECDLPPIPLHASTQTDNRSPEKVRFLEQVGFRQVVLARELGLAEIRQIREATTIPLEFFVHGALCVSFSGQCYISEAVSGRSANRGECAQFCRHRYTVEDDTGKVLARESHLLSLKDLDLSVHLAELIAAGISSFKIEGRLKGSSYVKNVTAYYRQLLDRLLASDAALRRASSGECRFGFTPDPAKSFNRGRTDYFLKSRRNTPGQPGTSKSLGELLGEVTKSARDHFTIATTASLHNGDGLCYFDQQGELVGVKANRVDGNIVFHRERRSPSVGSIMYRNLDVAFDRQLEASDSCRALRVSIVVEETADGLACTIEDEDGICSRQELVLVKETARKPGTGAPLVERQMQKSGKVPVRVTAVRAAISQTLFVRVAEVNELRRLAFEAHLQTRRAHYRREQAEIAASDTPWLSTRVTVLDNITNNRARQFYRRHGVEEFVLPEGGVAGEPELALMTSRYCVRNQLGLCPWQGKTPKAAAPPLFIRDNTGEYRLEFSCSSCEMVVRRSSGRKKQR